MYFICLVIHLSICAIYSSVSLIIWVFVYLFVYVFSHFYLLEKTSHVNVKKTRKTHSSDIFDAHNNSQSKKIKNLKNTNKKVTGKNINVNNVTKHHKTALSLLLLRQRRFFSN